MDKLELGELSLEIVAAQMEAAGFDPAHYHNFLLSIEAHIRGELKTYETAPAQVTKEARMLVTSKMGAYSFLLKQIGPAHDRMRRLQTSVDAAQLFRELDMYPPPVGLHLDEHNRFVHFKDGLLCDTGITLCDYSELLSPRIDRVRAVVRKK